MTWNEISDGQPGLALPAMQNWRHAGRFATDMVPLDVSGNTLTTGLLNLGTAGAPWANAYIATGGSIFVGGTAFEGGGGGAAVEVFEQKSHLDKIGYDYPLSNAQSQNESFMNSAAMVCTLGQTHLAADLTIFIDRDAATISAISTASATSWSPTPTGTAATNTTAGQSVNGTSVKLSGTFTNSSTYIVSSFTSFSLIDKDLKVWLYPDTVANATFALIRLESNTTTAYCEFQKATGGLTIGTLNSIYCNLDSPDTTTAGFTRSAINRVYLGVKTTAPQAIQWSWNYLRSVSNKALKLPMQMICDNGTLQEFINISTATVAGDKYTLAASTTNSHTISSSTLGLKRLTTSGGQGVIKSTDTGEAAKTGWDISRTFMNTSTSGDLILTSRWYDESYPVATITNASTTVLSVTTSTVKDGFKTGDVLRVYKYEYIDENYQSPQCLSIGANFLDLTLTTDGTATSSLLTLVHGNTSNQNLGGESVTTWRGVRVSADDYYRVESQTQSQVLVKATPDQFLLGLGKKVWATDNFNREVDSSAQWGGIWAVSVLHASTGSIDANNYLGILSNQGFSYNSGNGRGHLYGQYDGTILEQDFTMKIKVKATFFQYDVSTAVQSGFCGIVFGCNQSSLHNSGVAVYIQPSLITNGGSSDASIVISTGGMKTANGYGSGTIVNTTSIWSNNGNISSDCWFEVQRVGGTVKARVYLTTSVAPEWQVNYNFTNYILPAKYWGMAIGSYEATNTRTLSWYQDDFSLSKDNFGFIQKSTIPSVSGNKLITATRLTRQDATNQNPIIYQRNAVIT